MQTNNGYPQKTSSTEFCFIFPNPTHCLQAQDYDNNSCFSSSKSIHIGVEPYLFYNLYIVDPFGPPLQLRLPQCVQIVQIQTHETWIRLKEEHFKWYKEPLWIPSHLSIFVLIIGNQYKVYMLVITEAMLMLVHIRMDFKVNLLSECDIHGQRARLKWMWHLMLILSLLTSYLPVRVEQVFQILLFHVRRWQISNKYPSLQISRIVTAAGAWKTPWRWAATPSTRHNSTPGFMGFLLGKSQMLQNFWVCSLLNCHPRSWNMLMS